MEWKKWKLYRWHIVLLLIKKRGQWNGRWNHIQWKTALELERRRRKRNPTDYSQQPNVRTPAKACRSCQSTDHLVRFCLTRFYQACGGRGHNTWERRYPNYRWLRGPSNFTNKTADNFSPVLNLLFKNSPNNVLTDTGASCSINRYWQHSQCRTVTDKIQHHVCKLINASGHPMDIVGFINIDIAMRGNIVVQNLKVINNITLLLLFTLFWVGCYT